MRVLLVDDQEDCLLVMKRLFENAGAEVTTAPDGVLALTEVANGMKKSQDFEVVVLDIRMPKMNGYEAAEAIRELGYQGKIVALTATASGEGRSESLRSGVDVYIGKSSLKAAVVDALLNSNFAQTK